MQWCLIFAFGPHLLFWEANRGDILIVSLTTDKFVKKGPEGQY